MFSHLKSLFVFDAFFEPFTFELWYNKVKLFILCKPLRNQCISSRRASFAIFIVGTFKSTIAAFSFLMKYCGKMASPCMIVFVDKSESEG